MPTLSTPSPDPVIETQVFWMRYRTTILAAFVALVVAGLAYGAYQLYAVRRDDAAATMLAQAKTAPDFQKVIDQYGGTPAGSTATLLLADAQRKAQKFAEANATLQSFVSRYPKHELITTAKMALGANLESLRKADEALESYRKVAAEAPRSYTAPLAMLAQVHLLKEKGQIDQARQVCETVLTQYRESAVANEASQYLRTLTPAATPAPVVISAPAGVSPAPSAAGTASVAAKATPAVSASIAPTP